MTAKIRMMILGGMFSAVLGLVLTSGTSLAQPGKDLPADVKKIADELKKGNAAGAKKIADASAKAVEVDDMMHLYKTRSKGGLGWGSKAGPNPAKDGLEKTIQEISKAVPANFFKDQANNEEAVRWLLALEALTFAKTPDKDKAGGKTKKAWTEYTKALSAGNADLAKAITAKNGPGASKAATQITQACVSCHSLFKE